MTLRTLQAGAIAVAMCAGAAAPDAAQPTFSAKTELVVLHVSVRNGRGAYVRDLPRESFAVIDEGRPQEIAQFSVTDAPASIGLVIDNSGSMQPRLELVLASALSFVGLSNPADELFVLAFNEDVYESWPPQIIEQRGVDALKARLTAAMGARGQTALYDAISEGLARLDRAKHGRQVLVVISDGRDNASATPLMELVARIERSNAVIYTVAIRDPIDGVGDAKLLKRLATSSGGDAFEPARLRDVSTALDAIARDIRAVYTLGYVPSAESRPGGGFHRLRVVVKSPDGKTLRVRTRSGYRAGPGEDP